jgi:ribosomal protein S27AE
MVGVGHHGSKILVASILAALSLNWLSRSHPTLVPPLGLSLMIILVGTWIAMRRHDRSLCEHCAAGMPLAPSKDAERYANRLKVVHILSRPTMGIAYLAVVVASNFLIGSTIGTFVWALVQSTMAYLVLSHTTHRRLQPWCPECGEGGPGLIEHSPTTPFAPAS